MATAHLVHGYLAVGKTTFAKNLATDVGAVCISLDEWYLRLFSDGQPTSDQDYEALGRLWRMLDDHWPQVLASGCDVVLDFGYWSRASRDEARVRASAVGADVCLHWVRCDDIEARRRMGLRNHQDPHAFILDDAAYMTLRTRYEPPGDDEAAQPVDG